MPCGNEFIVGLDILFGFGLATILTPDPQNKIVFLVVWIAGTTSILWAYAGLKRVRMDERQLYVSNYLQGIYVPFSAITDVRQNRWINSQLITIDFRDAMQFGDKVTFMPKQRIQVWSVDPVVSELKRLAGLVAPGPDIGWRDVCCPHNGLRADIAAGPPRANTGSRAFTSCKRKSRPEGGFSIQTR